MYVRKLGTRTLIHTPAKLNLSLEVLGRRSDGFHEIETLMVAVSIYDTLQFEPADTGEIVLDCRWGNGWSARAAAKRQATATTSLGDLPQGAENIVCRALQRLREWAGIARGATIDLTKRIPAAAGLGGASSDAAAALVAANIGWQLGWSREQLSTLAAELGSDIPFFLQRGAAICRGRGERIEAVPPTRLHVVVVRPPAGLSTPQVYAACRPADSPQSAGPLVKALAAGQVAAASRMLNNRLEGPAARLTPWIARLRAEFARLDVLGHQMSGSGSSYFGICRHAGHARRVAAGLRSRDVGMVFAAATALAPAN
jgi:4-diphosphocytidyl-2-C-methyl-D-erythritol kinase